MLKFKKRLKTLLLTAVYFFIAVDAQSMDCLNKSSRTMPDGYVLTTAKCIGVLERFGELTGQDNSFFGTKKWQKNAAFLDKKCKYGSGKLSVTDEANFAKVNFSAYFASKNILQAKATIEGCQKLLDTAFK